MPKTSKILLLAVSVVLVVTVFLGVNSNPVSAASEPQDGAVLCEPVDVITGPGNVFVAAAKRLVRGVVGEAFFVFE